LVHITSPLSFNGTNIPRDIEIDADVRSGTGAIKKVEFYVDGTLLPKGTVTNAPYKYKWTATGNFGILRKIMVKAYQANGETGTDTVSVKVWNGAVKAPMPTQRYAFTADAVNGKIYVIGGYDTAQKVVEEYDPAVDKWTRKSPPQVGHAAHASCVINNIIYVFGGDKGFDWIPNVEAYNPATDTWTEKASIPIDNGVAFGMMGCVAYNGKAYLFGGFGSGDPINIGVYDPATDTWSVKSADNIFWPGATVANNQIFVFGGCPTQGMGACSDALNQTQLYDAVADKFTAKANMLYNQSAAAVAVVNNKIYVMGGSATNANCMEVYDPAADKWSTLPDMPVGATNFGASVVNGNIYIINSETLEYFTQ
jgi:N-acetylneuraminic acid mutarotase